MRDDYQRLLDIREGIERIGRYTSQGRTEFELYCVCQNETLIPLKPLEAGGVSKSAAASCRRIENGLALSAVPGKLTPVAAKQLSWDTKPGYKD